MESVKIEDFLKIGNFGNEIFSIHALTDSISICEIGDFQNGNLMIVNM